MVKKMVFLTLVVGFWIGTALGGTVDLPQTGQITCYNLSGGVIPCAGTGQDGEIRAGVAWPNPRFISSGECVVDNLTGLMWAKNANLPNGGRTWQGALDYVASMNSGAGLCGHHDWRLPNVNELESLVHAGQTDSAAWLNANGFTYGHSDIYWSSSSCAGNPYNAWLVNMYYGHVGVLDKDNFYYVWPVRSGQ